MAEPVTYNSALELLLRAAPRIGTERLALAESCDRVLRQDLVADRDQPPFDRSAMDGFALRADAWSPVNAETSEKRFRVVGEVPAGGTLADGLDPDPVRDVVRIATGAAVPDCFDAVVQIEKAAVSEGDETAVVFEINGVEPFKNIHRRGADAAAGDVVVKAGTVVQPHHLGIAAAVGATEIEVSRRPSVVVLSSGDEVQPTGTPTERLAPQHIRNSNGPMLVALLRAMGCEVLRHDHVVDEADVVRRACADAAVEADLVVTTGGVSVGSRDLFPTTWPELGYETVVHGIKMQPGKPVFVAKPPSFSPTDFTANPAVAPPYTALVVGLPGNPVSVLATAHLVVWPIVRKMLGLDITEGGGLPWQRLRLASPARPNPRREAFRVARFVDAIRDRIEVLPWQGSGDLVHTVKADGWVQLPAQTDELVAGSDVFFLPLLGGYADAGAK
ncbi:MAG: molybdopterin molybdotransferase MoeA [Planctomycetota bacterium]